jgi:hypothetical protein
MVVGAETLEELRVFTENQHSLISAPTDDLGLQNHEIRRQDSAAKLHSWLKGMFRSQSLVPNIASMATIHT